jgi:uncharacterized tellurite resistance protein B-like protein
MSRADDDAAHLARDVDEVDRVDYLHVVASLVAADRIVDDAELAPLEELCRVFAMSDDRRDAVLEAARHPDAAAVEASLARLKDKIALRVDLITDAIVIVLADGKVAAAESQELARLGRALEIAPAQIGLIARYVESVVLGDEDDERQLSRELAQGVAAAERGRRGPGAIRWLHRLFRRSPDPGQ